MRRFKLERQTPDTDFQTVTRSGVDALVYTYERGGKLLAVGYSGKRSRPDWHYVFATAEKRADRIEAHFDHHAAMKTMRLETRAKRKAEACHTVADVYAKAKLSAGISTPEVAICLRARLAKEFPGLKFSVTCDSYSGGSSIDIHWTDGPASEEVSKITSRYSFGGFDGMIDMAYTVSRWLAADGTMSLAESPGTEGSRGTHAPAIGDPHHPSAVWVRGGPKHVFCHRSLSVALKRALAEKVCAQRGIAMPETFTPERSLDHFLNTTQDQYGDYLSQLVHRASTGALAV